jgi:hypothetical protein
MELWNNLCAQKLLSTLPFKVKYSIEICPYIKRKKKEKNITHKFSRVRNWHVWSIYNTLVVDMSSIDWLCGIQINMTLFIYLFCFATLVSLLKGNFTKYLRILEVWDWWIWENLIFENQKLKVIWFVESRLKKGIFHFSLFMRWIWGVWWNEWVLTQVGT